MKKYIVILLCIGFSISNYAQNSIKGIVTDSENNPLLGVEIHAPDIHIGTTTNENGEYELNNLPKGEIQILYNSLGYMEDVQFVNLQNETLELNVVLEKVTSSPLMKS